MIRFLLAALFTLTGSAAFAQMESYPAKAQTNSIAVDLGFYTGGFAFGAAYEYMFDGAQGLGGAFHNYSKSAKRGANGYTVIGAFTSYHFFKKAWDFSLSPGMNIININPVASGKDSVMTVGPSLAISLTSQLNEKVAIGFDYVNDWVWFNEDYRGPIVSDLEFKVRVGF
jgi:hypothetical protein